MSHPTREDLLGYLLGALERTEHEQVENELAHNPQLREELSVLQRWVSGMGLADEPQYEEPPAGLAGRTCQAIALEQTTAPRVSLKPMQPDPRALETRSRTSLPDFFVAAAVLIAGVSLFFPALASSRFQAGVGGCQNRLRQLGVATQAYSDLQPDHSFPAVQLVGNRAAAGVYAPTLASGDWVTDPRLFVCPASRLAGQLDGWELPSLDQLDQADEPTLARYHQTMGGSFGYSMGYMDHGELQPPRNEHRSQYALLADAPSNQQPKRRTENHDGRGQNVLYEDGHVSFLTSLPAPNVPDDPFHNDNGLVAAGVNRHDSVIGNSADRPMPMEWIEESPR